MVTAAVPKSKARRLWTFDEMAAAFRESNSPTELGDGEMLVGFGTSWAQLTTGA